MIEIPEGTFDPGNVPSEPIEWRASKLDENGENIGKSIVVSARLWIEAKAEAMRLLGSGPGDTHVWKPEDDEFNSNAPLL